MIGSDVTKVKDYLVHVKPSTLWYSWQGAS